MAIDINELFAEALLRMMKDKPLFSITVKNLLEETGASRQTFYNHFRDRNDLVCYIYNTRIIPEYGDPCTENLDFSSSLLRSFENMKKYRNFMEQALRDESAGNLKDYIFIHCASFDMKWHQQCYGKKKMPEELKFATEYHAIASSSMTISWILSGMPVSCEEMVKMITQMRGIGMEKLFAGCEGSGNPYGRLTN